MSEAGDADSAGVARAPEPARGRSPLILILVVLALLGGAAAYLFTREDPPLETRAAGLLRTALLEVYPNKETDLTSAWTAGEAMAGLSAHAAEADKKLVRRMVSYVRTKAVPLPGGGALGGHGGWAAEDGEVIGWGEATGWVGIGLGLASLYLGDEETREAAETALKVNVSLQNPDGSFSSLFIGEEAARMSATQDMLLAMLVLDTALHDEPSPEVVKAVVKTLEWLGESFDERSKVWFPKRKGGWRGKTVAGCSETSAWLILEARDYLGRAGARLPTSAYRALIAYAGSVAPDRRDVWTMDAASKDDYVFDLPDGSVKPWGFGHRWSFFTYRLLLSSRLARSTDLPAKEAWAEEEAWLLSQLESYVAKLDEDAPEWQICEAVLAMTVIASREPDSPERGSTLDFIRRRRQLAP